MFLKNRFASTSFFPLADLYTFLSTLTIKTTKGQQTLPLSALLSFKSAGKSRKIGNAPNADLNMPSSLLVMEGTAVLANIPAKSTTASQTLASAKPLLIKNTFMACHNETKRQVGPAFAEIVKRKYSIMKW